MTESSTSVPSACIIGYPVKHSRSPLLHGYWLRQLGIAGRYGMREVAPEALADFLRRLRQNGFVGANVTVPHKTAAMAALAHADAAARAVGAVNTLWYEGDDLIGGNTDVYGFLANLDESAPGWDRQAGHAVVLGAGGASRAIVHGLLSRGLGVSLLNRTLEGAQKVAQHFGPRVSAYGFDGLGRVLPTADLLINTTSLGMAGAPPLSVSLTGLKPEAIVADAVYVPIETELLKAARLRGHRTVDGLGMLLHQAVPAFTRWFGVTPTVDHGLRTLISDDINA